MRIVLASKSPRRKELLTQIGFSYECMVSEKEEVVSGKNPSETVQALSRQKAEDICAKLSDREDVLVIGADTVVAFEDRVLGKPADREDAKNMLSMLAGKTHSVWTGVTLLYVIGGQTKKSVFSQETKVSMYEMTEEEIAEYVNSGECDDKAGAYAIQGLAAKFIEKIEGDYANVVGLPVAKIYQEMKELCKAEEVPAENKMAESHEDADVAAAKTTDAVTGDIPAEIEVIPEEETNFAGTNVKWYDKAVFYHIYPLGLCGCPHENNGDCGSHFDKLNEWAIHAAKIGCTGIYIGPLFESVGHGYETTDYKMVDRRIGTNEDFKNFVALCHKMGVKVVVDGVFNHTGREFFAFKDIKQNRENSRYKDWYCNVNFWGNNEYNDGFSYENWGGYNLLAKLNVWSQEVKNYLFDVVRFWVNEFDIDGIRLDAADVLDKDFMSELRRVTQGLKQDFWLMGEVIHGDYSMWANSNRLHSVTNYELHKGLYSGHNDHNYFEIAHTINRLNNLAQGIRLYTFVDNHDVARIYSKLNNKEHMYDVTLLLYTVPGVPSIYYGSEFAIEGEKQRGSDWNLRPCLELADYKDKEDGDLLRLIKKLGTLKKKYRELTDGEYKQLLLTNRQFAFARVLDGNAIVIAMNNDDNPARLEIQLPVDAQKAEDLIGIEGTVNGIYLEGNRKLIVELPANRGTVIYTGRS